METNNTKRTLASSTAIMNLLIQAGQNQGIKVKDEETVQSYLVRPVNVIVKDVDTEEFSRSDRKMRDFERLNLKKQIDSAIKASDAQLVEELELELNRRFPTSRYIVFKFETPQRIFCSMENRFYYGVTEFRIEESYLESEFIQFEELSDDLIRIDLIKGIIDLSTAYETSEGNIRYAYYSYLTMAEKSKINRITSKSKAKKTINFLESE